MTLAASNKIPFLATAGGHGATITYVNCTNGIEIDISNFNTVSIDASNNTMTVGGAVRFEDIIPPLYEAGKELRMLLALPPSIQNVYSPMLTAFTQLPVPHRVSDSLGRLSAAG